jgi:hypothetical protein
MRALEFGPVEELAAKYGTLKVVYPLPHESLTAPAGVITPHVASPRAEYRNAWLANREEVETQ